MTPPDVLAKKVESNDEKLSFVYILAKTKREMQGFKNRNGYDICKTIKQLMSCGRKACV